MLWIIGSVDSAAVIESAQRAINLTSSPVFITEAEFGIPSSFLLSVIDYVFCSKLPTTKCGRF